MFFFRVSYIGIKLIILLEIFNGIQQKKTKNKNEGK